MLTTVVRAARAFPGVRKSAANLVLMLRLLIVCSSVVFALVGAGCQGAGRPQADRPTGGESTDLSSPAAPQSSFTESPVAVSAEELPEGVFEPPSWLGERLLPVDAEGFGIATRTPKVLRDRRFTSEDLLPPPPEGDFIVSIDSVPGQVLRRSTWHPGCPVRKEDLSYLKMTFWGFDQLPHTGEMIVHNKVAPDVVGVFQQLYRAGWPIEEMRVTRADELGAPPTGDGNNTSAFVCRDARLSEEWSEHAYGMAIDINPFHNPYVRGDLTLPELAIAYRDRGKQLPGMIRSGDVVTAAFDTIGWGWGGDWTSNKDWMHFSSTGK